MKARIRAQAFELGFDLVGFTTAAQPLHAGEFRQWLADGCHGEMNYLARRADERADPSKLLPGVKSIVVVGVNYGTTGTAHLARYAAGHADYHDWMGAKLAQLAKFIGNAVWYVDTGPILERDLAQRAGIGWIGKHTNLISQKFGNWIFLGEVLTALELSADLPADEQCGTCRRCLDVCPTQAIVAPYRLDARRCISYLTIELKGSIPVELRPAIGGRIFGCDDCLEICPWNRFAKPVILPRPLPALTEMLAWNDQQFANFFRGTPIYRLKRRGWLRNICIALGNAGDRAAIPALQHALADTEALIREHAAWALSRFQ
jgi:epoxyqueuosine reductase